MKLNKRQREKLNDWINNTLDTALFEDDFDELEKIITAYESFPVEAEVKPESGVKLFEMNIYTGRVNGSDTHQKEAQYIKFIAKDKKQLEHLINLLCDKIRKTNTTGTHNEVLAGIIGEANRFLV